MATFGELKGHIKRLEDDNVIFREIIESYRVMAYTMFMGIEGSVDPGADEWKMTDREIQMVVIDGIRRQKAQDKQLKKERKDARENIK